MNDSGYVEQIRLAELQNALGWLSKGTKILEIGAGTGWQARTLSELGHQVEAVDLSDSNYAHERVWPIRNYDGVNLPFQDDSFDVVFSSNVLEHVEHLAALLRDMRRVVRPGGHLVHVVPSATWRLWTTVTYYPDLLRRVAELVVARRRPFQRLAAESASGVGQSAAVRRAIIHQLVPEAHGLLAHSVWSELFAFRRSRWTELLADPSLTCVASAPAGIFYTGNSLLQLTIPIAARKRLAGLLGSACHLFIFRKNQ
jgi:SAM-dependent methyltransferase